MKQSKVAENKARYEGSALQALQESSGHTICPRCYCCDSEYEEITCWQCGGMCGEMYEDDWDDGYCEECGGEGVIHVRQCLGRCDENGEHSKKVSQ